MAVKKSLRVKADLSLLLVALIWGLTFVTVKNAVADMAPYTFISIRFLIAFAFISLFCFNKLLRLSLSNLIPGMLLGVFLFAGYSFQTIGLKYTTASNAGFITGMSVVLVPIVYGIINRRFPSPAAAAGAVLASVGLAFICLGDGYRYNYGDVLVLMCALSFALHIVFVGRYAPDVDVTVLTAVQIGTVAVLSGIAALIVENHIPVRFTGAVWIGLLTTAIPATSLAYFIQSSMQRFTTPVHTVIILSMEPVFAGLFGFLLLGETLGVKGLWGAALVFAGMVLSEIQEVQRTRTGELSTGSES